MSANPQWDISRALRVAKLFHLVCGVRDACVTPFLTLYLRQLGLAAPWVGILMGTKHLIAASWAPFCAFLARSHQKRRVLMTASLLGSAGASLFMVLVPPLDRDPGDRRCNGSHSLTAEGPPPGVELTVTVTLASEPASNSPAGALSLPGERSSGVAGTLGFREGPGESAQEPFSYPPGSSVGSTQGTRNRSGVLLHPGTERPLSAVFRAHVCGSGASLGSFVGGFVVMRFSLPVLYQACCVLLLLWLALFLSIQPRLPQERKINYSKLLTVEASDTSDSEQGTERDWLVKAIREEHSDWRG
ncbi:TPA: major facilitator superfamily domain containing 6-like [Bos taurus]|nr:TPA: major facilitator superfamily domain containing 6-like [Bos taurus]